MWLRTVPKGSLPCVFHTLSIQFHIDNSFNFFSFLYVCVFVCVYLCLRVCLLSSFSHVRLFVTPSSSATWEAIYIHVYIHTCVCVCVCVFVGAGGLVAKSCLTFCDPMDCSPPGSSVHGILQARILEQFAIPSSRESPQPRD